MEIVGSIACVPVTVIAAELLTCPPNDAMSAATPGAKPMGIPVGLTVAIDPFAGETDHATGQVGEVVIEPSVKVHVATSWVPGALTAIDCVVGEIEIPCGELRENIMFVRGCISVCCLAPPESTTLTVKLVVPIAVGVPVIAFPLSESPAGSAPMIETVYGAVPPNVWMAAEKGMFWYPRLKLPALEMYNVAAPPHEMYCASVGCCSTPTR